MPGISVLSFSVLIVFMSVCVFVCSSVDVKSLNGISEGLNGGREPPHHALAESV